VRNEPQHSSSQTAHYFIDTKNNGARNLILAVAETGSCCGSFLSLRDPHQPTQGRQHQNLIEISNMETSSDTPSPENALKLKAQRDAILQGIEEGEKAIKEGRTCTHEQAKEKLKKRL
jgi:predicted transcriptional regulator